MLCRMTSTKAGTRGFRLRCLVIYLR
jgi:hypothetical protein